MKVGFIGLGNMEAALALDEGTSVIEPKEKVATKGASPSRESGY